MRFALDSVLDQPLRAMSRDINGYLRCEATVARTGVISYADIGGPNELILPEVLFNPASMESMIGVPITDQHPPEKLLSGSTAKLRQLGAITSVRPDGDYLVASMVITDDNLARKIEQGTQYEVSTGCRYGSLPDSGTWKNGEAYDSVQQGRLYNHVAIVPRGRCSATCGDEPCQCAVRRDSFEVSPMAKMKAGKDAPEDGGSAKLSKLMELCLAAYPTDARAALLAYQECMDEWGGAASDGDGDEGLDAEPNKGSAQPAAVQGPGSAKTNDPAGNARGVMDPRYTTTSLDSDTKARLDAMEARASAAEKALERQAKTFASQQHSAVSEHLAALDRARLVHGARFDSADLSPLDMDRLTLAGLYPDDKDEIMKYSAIEVAAHVKHAFHPKHGVPEIRAARANVGLDSFPSIAEPMNGRDPIAAKWAELAKTDRTFNGQGGE